MARSDKKLTRDVLVHFCDSEVDDDGDGCDSGTSTIHGVEEGPG